MAVDPALLEIMRRAATLESAEFVAAHVLGGDPYVFLLQPEQHAVFIGEVAQKVQVPSDSIRMIGSARVGFSLNQDHLLQPFGRQSDIDLVIVRPEMFDSAVLELRAKSRVILLGDEDERRRLKRVREDIFNGYLRPDRLPLSATLSKTLFPKLAGPYDHPLGRQHVVKAWLFKSWEHATICYSEYHDRIRPGIERILRMRGDL